MYKKLLDEAFLRLVARLIAQRLAIPVNTLVVVGLVLWFVLADTPHYGVSVLAAVTLVPALLGLAAGVCAVWRPVKGGLLITVMFLSLLFDISLGGQVLMTFIVDGLAPVPPPALTP